MQIPGLCKSIELALILSKIISTYQSGFIQGRSIADKVMMACEMIHNLNKKVRWSNVGIILDLAKAYDRLYWLFFIISVCACVRARARAFGFSKNWIDLNLIWRCF